MSFWPPQKNCSYYGRLEERAWTCSPDTYLLREGGRKPGGCEAAVSITWCTLHPIDCTACLWLLSPQLPCEPQVWGKEVVCSRLRRKPGKAAGTEDTPERLSLIALGKQNTGLFWSCAAGCLGVWKLAEWKELLSLRRYTQWGCSKCMISLILKAYNFCSAEGTARKRPWSDQENSKRHQETCSSACYEITAVHRVTGKCRKCSWWDVSPAGLKEAMLSVENTGRWKWKASHCMYRRPPLPAADHGVGNTWWQQGGKLQD